MKRLLTLALISFLFLGCKDEPKTTFTINGNAKGVYNGVRVYLKTLDFKTARERIIDTAIVLNEKFSFQGALENPELRFLTVNSVSGRLSIFVENNNIDINIDKDNISTSSVTGSSIHKKYKEYEQEFLDRQKKTQTIITKRKELAIYGNVGLGDSLTNLLKKTKEELVSSRFCKKKQQQLFKSSPSRTRSG